MDTSKYASDLRKGLIKKGFITPWWDAPPTVLVKNAEGKWTIPLKVYNPSEGR